MTNIATLRGEIDNIISDLQRHFRGRGYTVERILLAMRDYREQKLTAIRTQTVKECMALIKDEGERHRPMDRCVDCIAVGHANWLNEKHRQAMQSLLPSSETKETDG